MGEAKQEEAKPAEVKPEEKEEAKPSLPPPTVLHVDLHCVGCAKKIKRSILKCTGVEEVEVDMVQNQLTVKGVVDPKALCSTIQKKTMRMAKVLSPLPPTDDGTNKAVAAEVSGIATVEFHVNMHCEACAQQLRRKLLNMRGVRAVETELSERKVTVTGTMTSDKIVEYIHRRTGKLAKVIPPPPPPPPEEVKKAEEKKDERSEEKKEEKAKDKKEEEKPGTQEQANVKVKGGDEEQKKEEGQANGSINREEIAKNMAYWYGGRMMYDGGRMIYYEKPERMVQWLPIYVIEQPMMMPTPSPQMFSDENPNVCCIS